MVLVCGRYRFSDSLSTANEEFRVRTNLRRKRVDMHTRLAAMAVFFSKCVLFERAAITPDGCGGKICSDEIVLLILLRWKVFVVLRRVFYCTLIAPCGRAVLCCAFLAIRCSASWLEHGFVSGSFVKFATVGKSTSAFGLDA